MSERSPAMDIADLIRTNEAEGWTVYTGNEAPSPDDAITVYDTGGGQANADRPLYDPTIQVRVRSREYADGYTKALAIRDLLMIRTARDIGIWHYTGFWLVSDVAKIGRDDSDRELFTVNFRLMRERQPLPILLVNAVILEAA